MTKQEIKKELKKIIHPEINNNLVDLGMIGKIEIKNKIKIELVLPFKNVPIKQIIVDLIKKNLKKFGSIEINYKEMSKKQRIKFMEKAKEGWKL